MKRAIIFAALLAMTTSVILSTGADYVFDKR